MLPETPPSLLSNPMPFILKWTNDKSNDERVIINL